MLILTRKKGESIIINNNIEIQIISIEDGKVKIGIEAPKEIEIYRSEVLEKILENNQDAVVAKNNLKSLTEIFKK